MENTSPQADREYLALVEKYERKLDENGNDPDWDQEYEDDEEWSSCDICGLTDDHSLECPNNNSPFANLIREGYD